MEPAHPEQTEQGQRWGLDDVEIRRLVLGYYKFHERSEDK